MMTGTVKQPQTAPPGPAWPTGTRPRGAAAKAQLLLSPAGLLEPHSRHHQVPKCPQTEDFWPLPAGPSQSIPSLLEGGVSATNSSEISLYAPCPPEICSKTPSAGTLHLPWPSSSSQGHQILIQHLGGQGGDLCPHFCHLCPMASPAQAREGKDPMAKPNPDTSSLGSCRSFQPGKLQGWRADSLNGGSWQPTIIPQLICAHGWQREQ